MRTMTLSILVFPFLFTGCSPIRVTHAAGSDDSPIIIADGGGSQGTEGGRPIKTLAAPYTLVRHDEDSNHRFQFWDNFYIKDHDSADLQATCFEMPALPADGPSGTPAYARVVQTLAGTNWDLRGSNGFVLNSGNDAGTHNNENLVSLTAHMPLLIDTPGFIFDPNAALTYVVLTINGQSTSYPSSNPYPVRSKLAFFIHYCKNSKCPTLPNSTKTACDAN